MNTAYRVWDGKQMYYGHEAALSLQIMGNEWVLWRDYKYGLGFKDCITGSHEDVMVLMWGTQIRETTGEIKLDDTIYAGHIVRQESLDPDLCRNRTLIGEVKMIDGSWCIVNEKKEECRPLFSETATNKVIGDVYQNPELLEGAE